MPRSSPNRSLAEFLERLRARREELASAVLNRVHSIADPSDVADQRYIDGMRRTVFAAIDYGFAMLESTSDRPPEIPEEVLAQARLAARIGVSLETVLRRYCGGNTLVADLIIEEAGVLELPQSELKRLLRSLALSFEHLLAAVSDEYGRQSQLRPESAEQRRIELIDRLLAGELIDSSELAYNFDCWHLGLLASGPEAAEAIRAFAGTVDATLLLIERHEGTVWAWLGSRRQAELAERLEEPGDRSLVGRASLAVGEPGQGLQGWRLTHRQAAAALPVALRAKTALTRYAEVPLLASILRDDLLATSLRQLYLAPLREDRDGGEAAKSTLRAYFAASGNASSAAAALGVNRRTVSARLAAIEDRLGRPLDGASAEIESVLLLDELEDV